MKKELPVLAVEAVTAGYRGQAVIREVSLELGRGTMAGLLGPNGAGKSTLLKVLVGELEPMAGGVKFWGEGLEKSRQRVAYVPQRESVDWEFPVTVEEVVLTGTYGGLRWWQRVGRERWRRAHEALERVGMEGFRKRSIGELSGGQQQRVFLARALAQGADFLILDEPFAGVDAATEASIVAILKDFKESGRTLLVVHHDLQTAAKYYDSLILLNGRLVAMGPTEEVFRREVLESAYGGRLTLFSEVASRSEISRR